MGVVMQRRRHAKNDPSSVVITPLINTAFEKASEDHWKFQRFWHRLCQLSILLRVGEAKLAAGCKLLVAFK